MVEGIRVYGKQGPYPDRRCPGIYAPIPGHSVRYRLLVYGWL